MPRRIIRNAIHLDALPAHLTVAGTPAPPAKKARKATAPAATTAPRKRRAGVKRPMPPAFYKPLPGETGTQRAARLEAAFYAELRAHGYAPWEPEYKFALQSHGRKWAMDLAWPEARVSVEIEGFGHQKTNRYYTDIEKYNHAAALGWLLVRVTYDMIADGRALALVREVFAYRQSQSA